MSDGIASVVAQKFRILTSLYLSKSEITMETFFMNKQKGICCCRLWGLLQLREEGLCDGDLSLTCKRGTQQFTINHLICKRGKGILGLCKKVILEIQDHGTIIPPSILKSQRKVVSGVGAVMKLTQEQEAYLLALQITNPGRTNDKYVEEFHKQFHTHISRSFVLQFFESKYEYSGKFVMPNLVPLDKFCPVNIAQYVQF